MGKQVSNKGFTLIESLLIVSVLMICMLMFPFMKRHAGITLQYQMQELRLLLISAQSMAIREKRNVYIAIQAQDVQIDNTLIKLNRSTVCKIRNLHFTPLGNVAKAMSIHCSSNGINKRIVIQLGTGRMYVK